MSSAKIPPFSGDDARRLDVIGAGHSGLDYVDVRGDGRTIVAGFFGVLPGGLSREHFVIEGGEHETGIRVTSIRVAADEPESEGVVALRLDRTGDASTYTLRVTGVPGVDPLYSALAFTFDRSGKRLTDCAPEPPGQPAFAPPPHIDYLAKDYASFRRLLLDRAALIMPDWNEQHVPDINVTLLELLAYAGDQLSYFQDAVATEAYLATARKRVSVRRHARLLDYRMHEGANARVWISLSAGTDSGPIDPREIVFSTAATAAGPSESFEPLGNEALHVYAAHAPMHLYAWGNRACTLAPGATRATLRDAWEPAAGAGEPQRALRRLEAGAYVLFERVLDVVDGTVGAADPLERHVVRLTHVRRDVDPLYDIPVVEIGWAAADRVPFALSIAAPDPAGAAKPPLELSVVWGNIVPADHGRSLDAPETLAAVPAVAGAPYRPSLAQPNITFAEAYGPGSAVSFAVRDPRAARPQMLELVTTDPEGHVRRWSPVSDLLASGPNDARYVVEVDENGASTLRFGDGVLGRRPAPDATVQARYRVGNGTAGNVGAEAIANVALTGNTSAGSALYARNPLPASGGTAAESVDDVRALAPTAWRTQIARAVAPDDYARIAERDPRLQRAAAQFCWTGSRTIVRVALDPLGGETVDADLLAHVAATLEPVRRIGHDVEVVAATYVPLYVAVDVSVKSRYQRGHVRAAVEAALGGTTLPDGTLGFFHPDNLGFGQSIAQSSIIARVLAVTGVENVTVRRLERLFAPTPDAVPATLPIGPLEIAQLDGDATRPERGVLVLSVDNRTGLWT
jgi:hypothetical protein